MGKHVKTTRHLQTYFLTSEQMFVVPGVRSERLQGPDVGEESFKETKSWDNFIFLFLLQSMMSE